MSDVTITEYIRLQHHQCRRCRVRITPENTTLLRDERALGITLAEVEVCNRCRPMDDEQYGISCSLAARRSQAVA